MPIDFKPSDSPGDEDSWEKLAENLFGIDFTKSSEPPPELPVAAPSEAAAPDEDADEEGPPAGEAAEVEPAAPLAADATGADVRLDEIADDEDLDDDDADVSAEGDEEADEADTFWDALNGWDWGDEPAESEQPQQRFSRGPSSRGPSRGSSSRGSSSRGPSSRGPSSGGSSSRGPSPRETREPVEPVERGRYEETDVAAESAAAYRDEYVDDSDFGAGLLGEEPASAAEVVAPSEPKAAAPEPSAAGPEAPAAGEAAEADGAPKKRRRRRRRRPPRTDEAAPAEEQGATASGWGEEPGDEATEDDEESPAAEAGEPESDTRQPEAEPAGEKRRPSRRRSRRRRKPSPSAEVEEQKQETAAEFPSAALDDSEDAAEVDEDYEDYDLPVGLDQSAEDEDADEARPAANKIPTWEEAISYLLHKQPSEKRSGVSTQRPSKSTSGRRRSRRGSKSS